MTEVGHRLRQIRHARGKSLAAVAGLAGISPSYLSRLENGQRALDRRSLIVALARALAVAPADLAGEVITPHTPVEEPRLGAVRHALLAAQLGSPQGPARPVQELADRIGGLLESQQQCRHDAVGAVLPELIHAAHATERAGRDTRRVRHLITLLHVQGTQAWLRDVGAPLDVGWQAASLAARAAEAVDDPMTQGVAAFGTAHALLAAGAFDLAGGVLARVRRDTSTFAGKQITGMLCFTDSLLAVAEGRRGDSRAALDQAADLAERVGEGNALWFGFGMSNVATWRMAVALEAGEHAEAVRIAESANPAAIPSPQRQAAYWADYGRALSRVRGRRADAVAALRRAERISPNRVRRHPFTWTTLAELLARSRDDAAGRELRGMAFRAGLPI